MRLRALIAIALSSSSAWASVADPRPVGEHEAAAGGAASIGKHLGPSLASQNPYERLLALEYVRMHAADVTPELAVALATLTVDRTKVLSLQCKRCQTDCPTCGGCWGMQGASDCGWLREVGESARIVVSQLGSGPQRVALAEALWRVALQSDADAAVVASLMSSFGTALVPRLREALAGAEAARVLRLLMNFPPGKCADPQLAAPLARLMIAGAPPADRRAAVAVLVCGDGSPPWAEPTRKAVGALTIALSSSTASVLDEFPAAAPVVEPLAASIGKRMANRVAPDGRHGTRLLTVASAPAAALPGLGARLLVADESECLELLELISKIGPEGKPLKPAIMASLRRHDIAYWAIVALGAIRARLSAEDRRLLERAYRRWCKADGDCEPFSQVMVETFRRSRRP